MSLLNDMLRDLSSVQKEPEKESASDIAQVSLGQPDQRELLNSSGVIKPLPVTLLPSILVFILVVVLLWSWKQQFWLQPSAHIINSPVSAISNAVDEQLKPAATLADLKPVSPGEIKENIDAVSNSAEKIVASPSEEALGERLAALESAISRLSTAVEKSTAIEEANVAMSYVAAETPASIEHHLDNEEYNKVTESESESIQDPFVTSVESVPGSKPDISNAAIDAHLSIAPNPVSIDLREVEKAKALLAKNQETNAIIALQTFIATAKTPRESTKLLLDIFSAQQNVTALNEILVGASYLADADKKFYAAKIAVIQQREADAIQILEEGINEAGDQENYRALLAGLYQRAEKFDEAAVLYRRLLISSGEKPAYWLGFALAQDALNQVQTARQAYLRLAGYQDLQPQVRSYVEQRLAVLQ